MGKKNITKHKNNETRADNALTDFTMAIGANLSQATATGFNCRYSSVTLNRAEISQLYLEHGIVQVLIDQPVDDAFRGGIVINSAELSADDINKINQFLEQEQVIQSYAQALKWCRLYGGAGIIINYGQDLSKPLNINGITEKTPLAFHAVDRWELSYTPQGMSSLDQIAMLEGDTLDCPYNYYGHKLHKTNVIKIKGKEAPSLIRGQFGGWGVSEIEKIIRSYNQYLKHQNVTYELLDESKCDVFKIHGFNSAIATRDGAAKTARRISEASKIKNFQNALVLDKEDEYEQKTLAFSGLSEILREIRLGIACDLRMPMTKLFGMSASGFNSGEDDIENYNSMIESEIRSKCKSGIIEILKIVCKKVLDYVPDNISFDFKSLRIMSNKEESAMKTEALNRITLAVNTGMIPNDKAVELVNNEKIFDIELSPEESLSIEELKSLGMDTQEVDQENA